MPTIDASHQSPNHSSRHGAPITLIVLHATVGSYQSSLDWLCSPASQVSTHFLIRKDGHIAQLVPDDLAAWHAGESAWEGLDSQMIQNESIGVELENANDGHDPYPAAQIAALTWLARLKIDRYAIHPHDIVRHRDIAQPPGRKTDLADNFPWESWKAALPLRAYRAGPFGAIAFQDRRPESPAAAVWLPGESILVGDVTDGWAWVAKSDPRKDVGFIPLGCLQAVAP